MSPISKVGGIKIPKLFIAGADDQHTTLEESERMFATAAEPKEFWIVKDASHTDLYAKKPDEYEQRILTFFKTHLENEQPREE